MRILTRLLLPGLLLCASAVRAASAESTAAPDPRSIVTAGCSLISPGLLLSVCSADTERLQPLIWGTQLASADYKQGLQGMQPSPAWLGNCGSGRLAIWDGHPGFFTAGADGRDDNERLRFQLIDWLRGGGSISFARGHGEQPMNEVFSGALWQYLQDSGVATTELEGSLSEETLAGSGLLVLGSSWQRISPAEADSIERFVRSGGGLLVIGISWAYKGYAEDPDPQQYIPNVLGQRFGWHCEFCTMHDPGAPNGDAGQPAFEILPPSDYRAARLVVLTEPAEIESVAQAAADRPQDLFVIEGRHIGICLPNEFWQQLDSPGGLLALFDSAYESHMRLLGNLNPPYGGEIIWYVPEQSDDPGWYMHSGNPIVYKGYAAEEIVRQFNEEGRLGWGLVHELGHDMHIESCGNNMVPDGTGENFANIFSVWTNETLGWPQHEEYGRAGLSYHEQAAPDYAQLSSDNWILLGCLKLIWDRYGWDGTQAFLTDVARQTEAGLKQTDNAERQRLLIEGLSIGYGVDFSDLFAHWGFVVGADTRERLSAYPACDIARP